LKQSTKHAVAVNGSAINNSNPCDGQGRVSDPTYSYKEGDIVTFAVNICNTGTSDLTFSGSGDNSHAIILTDVLGNLAKPAAGWNASVSCGLDCQVGTVDDTSQPGKVIFSIQAKPGSPTNRLVGAGG